MPLLKMDELHDAALWLKTLGHPIRLHMVQLMLRSRYAVGELAEACDIPSHVASEHLRLMSDRGLLSRERDGHRIYYQVSQKDIASLIKSLQNPRG